MSVHSPMRPNKLRSSSRRSTWTIRTAAAAVSLTALLLYMFPCLVCAGLPFTEPKPFSTKDTRVGYQGVFAGLAPRKELHCPLSGQTYNDAGCRSFTVRPKTNLWTTNVWSVFAPKLNLIGTIQTEPKQLYKLLKPAENMSDFAKYTQKQCYSVP